MSRTLISGIISSDGEKEKYEFGKQIDVWVEEFVSR